MMYAMGKVANTMEDSEFAKMKGEQEEIDFPVPFDWSICSPDGAHFHFIVAPGTTAKEVRELARLMNQDRDVYSYAYAYDRRVPKWDKEKQTYPQ